MEREVKPVTGAGRPAADEGQVAPRIRTPPKVLFRAKLGLPLGGGERRSTPDLCLWAHGPRPDVTIAANSDSVTVYGCGRHRYRRRWGRPLGVRESDSGADEKGEVQSDAEDSRQPDLEEF